MINISIKGLYKIPATSVGENTEKYVCQNNFTIVNNKPLATDFFYIVTPNEIELEKGLEHSIMKDHGEFWKALPLGEIVDKQICEMFFKITKMMEGNEKWKKADSSSIDAIPF